jgi:Trypsin
VIGSTWPHRGDNRYEIFVVIIHHRYRESHQYFDLALIETDEPMQLDGQSSIQARLPEPNADAPPRGKLCKFAGFGSVNIPDEDRPGNERLYWAEVTIEDNSVCSTYWSGYNMDDHLCGKTSHDTTLFSGDSGGPLICDYLVVGMFRAGVTPDNIDMSAPQIFLDLAEFREYINNTMNA